MKSLVWAVVTLLIAVGIMFECRYTIKMHSPIVARLDRLTGDVWIVNSGVWKKVEMPHADAGKGEVPAAASAPHAAK